MAIRLRPIIKINPVDIDEKQAIGVRLPFGKRSLFVLDYTTKEHAKSKLTNLLLTSPGERLNLPFFGIGLKNQLFEQITQGLEDNLKSIINTQVSTYVPEITIKNITVKDKGDIIYLTINYKVIANSEDDSVTLSFTNNNFENQ